jgi:hypothetical protein
LNVPEKGARQCTALRRCIPWNEIERDLNSWQYNHIDQCKIKLAHFHLVWGGGDSLVRRKQGPQRFTNFSSGQFKNKKSGLPNQNGGQIGGHKKLKFAKPLI